MKTALLVICTGLKYHPYLQPLLYSARDYFVPHTPVVFSNNSDIGMGVRPYMVIGREDWPGPTLHRYHTFLKAKEYLSCFDQLFYIDVDMLFVAPVGEEVYSDGITATLHPGFVGTRGSPETRILSNAYCTHNTAYYCGGFNGGESETFLKMAETLRNRIDLDEHNGITAIWHDESHLNAYLCCRPPAKVLDPSYCYPENAGPHYLNKWRAAGIDPTPKIIALEKSR